MVVKVNGGERSENEENAKTKGDGVDEVTRYHLPILTLMHQALKTKAGEDDERKGSVIGERTIRKSERSINHLGEKKSSDI